MSFRYYSNENINDSINRILNRIFESDTMYEINIKEVKLNNEYENVDIKIRKINE